jgi:hypothetical protein
MFCSKFAAHTTAPVVFTNLDATTSGNWTNAYGVGGYIIAFDATPPLTNLPSYVSTLTLQGQQVQVWGNPTNDPRALWISPSSRNRIASAWTTADSQNSAFTIDLNFADVNTHRIALYCVDWLGSGTIAEKIEVFDSTDTSYASPLDTRHFTLPHNGVFLMWQLAGHRVIRVTHSNATPGDKAMVSAIFFGGGF